jgi:L-fuconolactonase
VTGLPSRVIDAHHHLWDRPGPADYPWITGPLVPLLRPYRIEHLAPLLAAVHVTATVVVQARADRAETEHLLGLAAGHPLLAGVVGWTDLTAPDAADQIDALRAGPGGDRLVGLRHGAADEDDPDWLLRDDIQPALAHLADRGLTFDLEITQRELPAAIRLVRAYPSLRFVLDHLAKPPIARGWSTTWASGLAGLAAEPNVCAKLSGLVTEADWATWTITTLGPYVDLAVSLFGPDRLMAGSDWPVCTLAGDYHRVFAATAACLRGLTHAQLDQVFAGTAIDWYRLQGAHS